MKKVFIFLFAVMMSVSMSAEVLFTEDFTAGIGTSVESNNGWFTPYDGASGVSITNGLEFPDYVMSGVGNAVLLDGNCGQYQPHHSFAEVSQGSVYVSFMFQPFVVGKAGWFFCLRDAYSQSTFNYVARIHLSADGLLGLRFYKTAEAVFDETMPLDGQNTYLVVLKYTIVEGTTTIKYRSTPSILCLLPNLPRRLSVRSPMPKPRTSVRKTSSCAHSMPTHGWYSMVSALPPRGRKPSPHLLRLLRLFRTPNRRTSSAITSLVNPYQIPIMGLLYKGGSKYRRMRIFSL